MSRDTTLTGDIAFDTDMAVTLEAGYDCDYAWNTVTTTVSGSMTVSDGTVTLLSGTLAIQ